MGETIGTTSSAVGCIMRNSAKGCWCADDEVVEVHRRSVRDDHRPWASARAIFSSWYSAAPPDGGVEDVRAAHSRSDGIPSGGLVLSGGDEFGGGTAPVTPRS